MSSHRHDLAAIADRAMLEAGFLPSFSADALRQLSAIGGAAAADRLPDLTALPWASIDNDDSRDLDQLSVGERAGDRTVVRVAVADVDSLVPAGTPLDSHARHNTTSVYTAPKIYPMLPAELSTDRTSLNQDEDRAAIVITMTIHADGACSDWEVRRARVRNRAKLAYDAVAAWLDGRGPAPARVTEVPGLETALRVQDEAARVLRGVRDRRGALRLETIETRPVFEGDRLRDIRPQEKNRARELIEDFMIAANEVIVQFLESRRFPSLRRILPLPERWDRIVEVAAETGWTLPDAPDASALNAFLLAQRDADPARFPDLSLVIIKLLGSGEYAVHRPGAGSTGHFGLAVADYTHSTAPNRRFPDLITQRLVKAALDGRPQPYAPDELDLLARHCTEQEDIAKKVERRIAKSAAALLLEKRVGERFDGVVTGVSDKGTWVRIFRPPVEGKLVHGAEGLDVGHRVGVELVGTDVERGFIDFARVRGR